MTSIPSSADTSVGPATDLHVGGQAPADLAAVLASVRQITEKLFPGSIQIEADSDPEDPNLTWWDVWVDCAAEHAVLREMRYQWHEAVRKVAPNLVFSLQVRRQ